MWLRQPPGPRLRTRFSERIKSLYPFLSVHFIHRSAIGSLPLSVLFLAVQANQSAWVFYMLRACVHEVRQAYFMYTIKWSVMQYVIVRPGMWANNVRLMFHYSQILDPPAISVAGIISQAFGVLCTQSYSPHFAQVYLTAIDFVSIRYAIGLINLPVCLIDRGACC